MITIQESRYRKVIVRVLLVLFTIHYSLFTSTAQTLTGSAPSIYSLSVPEAWWHRYVWD